MRERQMPQRPYDCPPPGALFEMTIVMLVVPPGILAFAVWHVVYFHTEAVMYVLENFGLQSAAIMTALVSALGLAVSNVQRYVRAETLGIPYRQTYASAYESFDALLEIGIAGILGLVLPLMLQSAELPPILLGLITFMSVIGGWAILMMNTWVMRKKQYPCKSECATAVRVALVIHSILSGIGYALVSTQSLSEYAAKNATALAIFTFIFFAVVYIVMIGKRLEVYSKSETTCEVDGKTYLVGMKHDSSQWWLLPCKMPPKMYCDLRDPVNIEYERSGHIVRSLHEVNEVQVHEGAKITASAKTPTRTANPYRKKDSLQTSFRSVKRTSNKQILNNLKKLRKKK